jgi:hypothetical protein
VLALMVLGFPVLAGAQSGPGAGMVLTTGYCDQTLPASRLPRSPPPFLLVIVRLIPLTTCWTLIGAHGRARSRTAQVSEGMAVLSEAPSLSIQLL